MLNGTPAALLARAPALVQRRVEPLLLSRLRRAFDVGLYVLVTSFHPLEAYLYTEGFARLATEPYSLEPEERHNMYAHLTNSSIQKERPDAADGTSAASAVPSLDAAEGGTKIALSALRERLGALSRFNPTNRLPAALGNYLLDAL